MLEYDGPLVRKNKELSEFTHEVVSQLILLVGDPAAVPRWSVGGIVAKYLTKLVTKSMTKALLARNVPYSHPIYGALEPKGRSKK